jgi:hypothetical protein
MAFKMSDDSRTTLEHKTPESNKNVRALCQSERFERAWSLLGETYKRSVILPRKVIAFNKRR